MSQIKLKPCPFCGNTNIGEECRQGVYYVACENCGSMGPEFSSDALRGCNGWEEAAHAWNRRASKLAIVAKDFFKIIDKFKG